MPTEEALHPLSFFILVINLIKVKQYINDSFLPFPFLQLVNSYATTFGGAYSYSPLLIGSTQSPSIRKLLKEIFIDV